MGVATIHFKHNINVYQMALFNQAAVEAVYEHLDRFRGLLFPINMVNLSGSI